MDSQGLAGGDVVVMAALMICGMCRSAGVDGPRSGEMGCQRGQSSMPQQCSYALIATV